MARTAGAMLGCLLVGASGMWAASNFRLRVEAVGGPEVPAAPPAKAEPDRPAPLPPVADPHVRPAGGIARPPAPADTQPETKPEAPAAPKPPLPDVRVVAVNDSGFRRTGAPLLGTVPLIGSQPELVLDRPLGAGEALEVTVNDRPVTVTPAASGGTTALTLDLAPPVDPARLLRVKITPVSGAADGRPRGRTAGITLARPAAGSALVPSVTEFSNSPYLPLAAQTSAGTVYTGTPAGTYARLRGLSRPGGAITFLARVGTEDAAELAPTAGRTDPATGVWDYTFNLGPVPAGAVTVVARAEYATAPTDPAGGHAYSAAFTLTAAAVPSTALATPTIRVDVVSGDAPPAEADPAAETPAGGAPKPAAKPASKSVVAPESPDLLTRKVTAYRTNAPRVRVTVDHGAGAEGVQLTVDGAPLPARAAANDSSTAVTFEAVDVPLGGDHALRAVAFVGAAVSPPAQVGVKVRTEGPTVLGATSPELGTGAAVERIVVKLTPDSRLDPRKVLNLGSYALAGLNGLSDPALSAPVYDPVADTITLTVSGAKPGSYAFSIPAGADLADEFGNKLRAGEGADGTVLFRTVLFTRQPDQLPSESRGVTLQTGPNVTFPEYTRFRRVPDGFNPSDRVETRVVRLYYSRDAHRVAQIVNRDVKSYNAATVDIRRRAADRARDEANEAVDNRRRLERAAVQAAQESRAAEAQLAADQNQAAAARVRGAEARNLIAAKELELAQARRDLQAATDQAAARAAADPGGDPAVGRVDQVKEEVRVLKADIAKLKAVAENPAATPKARADAEAELAIKQRKLADAERELSETAADGPRVVAETGAVIAAQKKYIQAVAETRRRAADRDALKGNPGADRNAVRDAEVTLAAAEAAQQEAEGELERATLAAQKGVRGDVAAKRSAVADATDAVNKAQRDLAAAAADLTAKAQAEQALRERAAQLAQAERDLAQAEREQARAVAAARGRAAAEAAALDPFRARVERLEQEVGRLRGAIAKADEVDATGGAGVSAAQARVAAARAAEAKANEAAVAAEALERRKAENQFRREVAAAREDPDTYAPGVPDSDDPVRQCSISVIGEGLIQIRGPIKGLNVIRTMINQIDAPAGQVQVAVHTVQVNGEKGNRMEKVVANIQRHLDHSRFLTVQSGQMLRKAVTQVASRKAQEVEAQLPPGCTQADRDARYLAAFFGKDFIDELVLLDSEFLKTGNKVLSLHSMDSTSLSSALFLLSLAKNEVRREVVGEFLGMVSHQLPAAEQQYYLAGLGGSKCEACCKKDNYLLAYNAKFVSFLGFFDAEVAGTDTLTPVQREFVRLAQIFKARMVTEIQLKQRVYERSLVEERFASKGYGVALREASDREDEAQDKLRTFQERLQAAIAESNRGIVELLTALDDVGASNANLSGLLGLLQIQSDPPTGEPAAGLRPGATPRATTPTVKVNGQDVRLDVIRSDLPYTLDAAGYVTSDDVVDFASRPELQRAVLRLAAALDEFVYQSRENQKVYQRAKNAFARIETVGRITLTERDELIDDLGTLIRVIQDETARARGGLGEIQELLRVQPPNAARAAARYQAFKDLILPELNPAGGVGVRARGIFARTDLAFRGLAEAGASAEAAARVAQLARRPLDEKKLLDLLVDELEDKFIEILEGTRAHTANVDNYLKAVTSALDDDFNTQFYHPSFRRVREASRYWDVTLGQVETTTVLTNNRQFAKVSPAATFEFDLPKRNILITEGFQSAKALVDEYGALLNDPTFLALGKLYSGQPTAGQFGGGGVSAVRNVLPGGLPTSADETILAQAGPNRKEFGSALEALIPDPAIYKFETGTGYEIRPVLAPDGQAVVFHLNYLYSTEVREPVRADEKHLGRIKRHFIDTDVSLLNFELKEVSKYVVGLKAARTARGVPLLGDIPGVGVLFRPLPSAESALQQNLIYSQATIFPTLFDLMGLRYAPAVADLDPLADRLGEFSARYRRMDLEQRLYDITAARVDDGLRTPPGERRPDLYRSQITLPHQHPNGYYGPGLRLRDGALQEGPGSPYDPRQAYPPTPYAPWKTLEDATTPLPPGAYLLNPGPPGMAPPPGELVPVGPPPGTVTMPSPGRSAPKQLPSPRQMPAVPPTPPAGPALPATRPPLGTTLTPTTRPLPPATPVLPTLPVGTVPPGGAGPAGAGYR